MTNVADSDSPVVLGQERLPNLSRLREKKATPSNVASKRYAIIQNSQTKEAIYTAYDRQPPERRRYWALVIAIAVTVILGIAWISLLIVELIFSFAHSPMQNGGSVALTVPLETLGFGSSKRLMLINITEMGGYGNMHLTDKQHATLQIWGQKADQEDGNFTGELYHIGIEYKGGGLDERTKPNYGIEMWKEDGTDTSGNLLWDDTKETLFFEDKMEDFVLRGGFYEPTLTRDIMAPKLSGASYATTLIELVFVDGNRFTYEGVYMLMQDIGRRQLEKHLKWSSNGKTKNCDEMTPEALYQEEIDKVALVFEYDVVSERKKVNDTCSSLRVISDYPKCSFFAEQAATPYSECASLYKFEHDRFAAMLTLGPDDAVPAEIDASIPALAHMFISEQLMLDQGFGSDSEFFYVAPRVGDEMRSIGAVSYDHDETHWRLLDPSVIGINLIDFWNLKDEVTGKPIRHMPLWSRMATYEPFLEQIRANGTFWIDEMLLKVEDVYATRIAELEAGYWERNNARWPIFGTLVLPRVNHQMSSSYISNKAITKSTMAEELTYARGWLRKRAARVRDLLASLETISNEETDYTVGAPAIIMRRLTPLIVVSVLLLCSSVLLFWVWLRKM